MKVKYIFISQVQTLFIFHAANWLEEIVRQLQGLGEERGVVKLMVRLLFPCVLPSASLRHHDLASSTNVGIKVALRADV